MVGRKRKVPEGFVLRNWDDDSTDDEMPHKLPRFIPTMQDLLRQDCSSNPSLAQSTDHSSSETEKTVVRAVPDHVAVDVPGVNEDQHLTQEGNSPFSHKDDEHLSSFEETSDADSVDNVEIADVPEDPRFLDESPDDSDAESEPADIPEDPIFLDDSDDEQSDEQSDDDSWIGSDPDEDEADQNAYYKLLQALSEKWLIVELTIPYQRPQVMHFGILQHL